MGKDRRRIEGRASYAEWAAVACVAVVVRAVFLVVYRDSPFYLSPILDSAWHHELAQRIAAGEWSAGAPYFRPPLFVWLLGLAYRLAGDGMAVGRLLSASCGVATAVAVTGCAGRLGFSRRWRWGAGLAAAVYAPALFFEGELLAEPLATALAAWGLYAALGAQSADSTRGWMAASLWWALAALARAPLALLPFVAVYAAGRSTQHRTRRRLAVGMVTILIWCGPALLMEKHGAGFRFPSTQGGINFYAGNHPAADGRSVSIPELSTSGGGREFVPASIRVAATHLGKEVTPVAASSWWWSRGWTFWREHPATAMRLTLKKTLYLVHGYETPNNRSLYAAGKDVPGLALGWIHFPGAYWPGGLLFPLAVLGAWANRRRARWRLVTATATLVLVPLILFFISARFRLPAYPAMILLSVAGLQGWTAGRSLLGVVFLALYLTANLPWASAIREDPAREHLARGEAALGAGQLEMAKSAYHHVLRADPNEGRAELGLAVIADRQGNSELALQRVEASSRHLPGYWAVEEVWARILDREGRPQLAVEHLEAAVADFPENGDLWGRLGLTWEALGKDARAREALERAARLQTRDPEAWNSVGRFRRLAGDAEGAAAAWNRALRLDPLAFKPRFNRGLLSAENKEFNAAIKDLEQAIALAPDADHRDRARRALATVRRSLP